MWGDLEFWPPPHYRFLLLLFHLLPPLASSHLVLLIHVPSTVSPVGALLLLLGLSLGLLLPLFQLRHNIFSYFIILVVGRTMSTRKGLIVSFPFDFVLIKKKVDLA